MVTEEQLLEVLNDAGEYWKEANESGDSSKYGTAIASYDFVIQHLDSLKDHDPSPSEILANAANLRVAVIAVLEPTDESIREHISKGKNLAKRSLEIDSNSFFCSIACFLLFDNSH